MQDQSQKRHRKPQAGRKLEKKNKSRTRPNTKGFAVFRANKAARLGQRTSEISEKRLHVPLVDRTPLSDPPPLVVAVVGPPKVGKSTLIKCLVRRYAKQNLSVVTGPITVVSGKSRRLTFLECKNDLNAMIDTLKVADIVLLLINASFGFEMETFEFLNVAQNHGFPKTIGVMTHLDTFTSVETLRKTKRTLKHRFWTEIYDGAKLFSLSGLVNEKYLARDVLNLSRLLSVAKPRPLIWKNSHSYMLVDRIEDLTDADHLSGGLHVDRKVALYGWVRGVALRPGSQAHIAGVGDVKLDCIEAMDDPCPPPDRVKREVMQRGGYRRRTLKDLERRLYAPMADSWGVLYDKDAVYLDVTSGTQNPMLQAMRDDIQNNMAIDSTLSNSKMSLLRYGQAVTGTVDEDNMIQDCESEEISEDDEASESEQKNEESIDEEESVDFDEDHIFTRLDEGDSAAILDEEDDASVVGAKWKAVMSDKIGDIQKMLRKGSVMSRIYGDSVDIVDEDEEVSTDAAGLSGDVDVESLKKTRFLTGGEAEDEGLGEEEQLDMKKAEIKRRFEMAFDYADKDKGQSVFDKAKKEMADQKLLNQAAFEGDSTHALESVRGFLPGTYVRIILDAAPAELVEYFDPTYPVIVGGLSGGNETQFGLVHARVKRHRWHERVLKTNEPLIWSVGWRRFQSMPLFYTKDAGDRSDGGVSRLRLLKYTPKHMHCMAVFYGPLVPQNTGLVACLSVKNGSRGFRISMTGVTVESGCGSNFQIVKKLKLTGIPKEISGHTAIISGMFSSELEIAKFEGAALRSVSGVRGQIKKAVGSSKTGLFRATFEDRLLASDIVFLRAWVPVEARKLYNPVTSLLLQDKEGWIGMRLNYELRREANIGVDEKPDSVYRMEAQDGKERRVGRKFNPLRISKRLQETLPFASKPKLEKKIRSGQRFENRRPAVVLEKREKDLVSLLQHVSTLKNAQDQKRKIARRSKRVLYERKKIASHK